MTRDPWTNNRTRDANLRRLPLYKEPQRHPTSLPMVILVVAVVMYFAWQYCR